jgi:iron complex transport system ATP-binding protein
MLSGNIVVDGRPLSDFSDQELSHVIGIVLTGKPDVQNMTVEDIVALGRSPYTGFWGTLDDDDRAIVEESMSLVGITHLRSRMIQTLSDGERQKMMIAKALAQQTPVIFLDEPTAFLDYPSKVEMLQLLRRLSHDTDKIIFLSTHDMELALQIADELWLMAPDGISLGTPQQLADNGKLSAFINRPGITFDTRTLTIKITAS